MCCPFSVHCARYDFVEIEDPTEKTILGRWCGSQSLPGGHISKGSQITIRFISDEYFPSEPGFCIRYSLLPVVRAWLTAKIKCALWVGKHLAVSVSFLPSSSWEFTWQWAVPLHVSTIKIICLLHNTGS